MKCKRCLTQVRDDVDICPNCGQDLTSLRQLLKDFYSEEPNQSGDQGLQPPRPESSPPPGRKEGPQKIEPRIILDRGQPAYGPDLALSDRVSSEELPEEEGEGVIWERPLKGTFWLRSMAFAVDQLILVFILAIFAVVGFFAAEIGPRGGREIFLYYQIRIVLPILLPLAMILVLTYFTFFHGAWGQTIGKMIFRLRVLKTNGQPLTFSRALARTVAYTLSAIPFFLGFFWVGFTSKKCSWHDVIAGTMVVREQ
jgi:uncharacterized RDD family membrane protein YckC